MSLKISRGGDCTILLTLVLIELCFAIFWSKFPRLEHITSIPRPFVLGVQNNLRKACEYLKTIFIGVLHTFLLVK